MAFDSKVIKVFIACPNDVKEEKQCVRETISIWNALNSEEYGIVYLPVSWDTHSVPESDRSPQDYINEELLDKCDILIALFWSTVGSKTGRTKSASIEEITRHVAYGKRAMIYFCNRAIPIEKISDKKLKELMKWRDQVRDKALYGEFNDIKDLNSLIDKHLTQLARSRKYRVEYDSDKLALIKDDAELAVEISIHFASVSVNLIKLIHEEDRSDVVWNSILTKLEKSPAELRDSLIFLAQRGAFKHYLFEKGCTLLANKDQSCFGGFMSDLYAINKFEFKALLDQGLFHDSIFKDRLMDAIRKRESGLRGKRIIV